MDGILILDKSPGKTSQKAVSEVAKVTEVTVRNRYKEIIEKLGIDVKI